MFLNSHILYIFGPIVPMLKSHWFKCPEVAPRDMWNRTVLSCGVLALVRAAVALNLRNIRALFVLLCVAIFFSSINDFAILKTDLRYLFCMLSYFVILLCRISVNIAFRGSDCFSCSSVFLLPFYTLLSKHLLGKIEYFSFSVNVFQQLTVRGLKADT